MKTLLIFHKRNFLALGVKKRWMLQEEPVKPENQTRSYSLELLTYYCIDYSLATRLLTTHPIIDA